MKRSLHTLADLLGVARVGDDLPYTAISTDTRQLQAGQLYWALRGPNFDGNDFVAAAAAAGAVAAVVERAAADTTLPQFVVDDSLQALQRTAAAWRQTYPGTVLGVAGSNGKTTTKEMLAAILACRGQVLATRGNLNNHIGVPLTLLRLETGDAYAVVEMGANAPGDVAALVAIAKPDVGLITNAGAEHLAGFGDLDGVARAEGEMVAGLAAGGTAILNADDPYFALWQGMTAARVVGFGTSAQAQVRATAIRESLGEQGFRVEFQLHTPAGDTPVLLNVGGRHNVLNALAAAAAALAVGATVADVAAGLAAMQPVAGRLRPGRTRHGARLLDDSYNANPDSMRAGIDVLVSLGGTPWMVLADMAELGDAEREAHADIGRYARDKGVRRLFCTGPLSTLAAEAFGDGASWYPDVAALGAAVDASLTPQVELLVKGSRSNRLERVVAMLGGTTATGGH